jgi:hypothetical protein
MLKDLFDEKEQPANIAAVWRMDAAVDKCGISEEQLEAAVAEAERQYPRLDSMVDGLEAFRKEVGEEMWQSIAGNPSLPQLVEKFHKDHNYKLLDAVATEFSKLFPSDVIDRQTIARALVGRLLLDGVG